MDHNTNEIELKKLEAEEAGLMKRLETIRQKKKKLEEHRKGRGWSHIIDKIHYSGGPGDNIYIYG